MIQKRFRRALLEQGRQGRLIPVVQRYELVVLRDQRNQRESEALSASGYMELVRNASCTPNDATIST